MMAREEKRTVNVVRFSFMSWLKKKEAVAATPKVVGGETEYGFQIEIPDVAVERSNIQLSHLLVTAYPPRVSLPAASSSQESSQELYDALLRGKVEQHWGERVPPFHSHFETPGQDIRGVVSSRLPQSDDEYEVVETRARRTVSITEDLNKIIQHNHDRGGRSDRFLDTGDRLYVDHNHPELSFSEVISAKDAVRYQKAAHLRMNIARKNAQEALRSSSNSLLQNAKLSVYAHNHDFAGHTFGSHENYLLCRSVDPHYLITSVMPFFVSRIAFVGLGTLGDDMSYNKFSISQRALFTVEQIGVQTTHDRPIVNTRDEPHAERQRFYRHHVISGDANHAEWALYLKYGTMMQLLKMIEDGALDRDKYVLQNPVEAMHAWSHDTTVKREWPLVQGNKKVTAAEHLAMYVDDMLSYTASHGASDEEKDVLEKFSFIVQGLMNDPLSLDSYLDWPLHYRLVEELRQKKGFDQSDNKLKNISLRYSDINPETSLYQKLVQKGKVARIVTDEEILDAFVNPPSDTRAYIRGMAVKHFSEHLEGVSWDGFRLKGEDYLFNPLSGTKEQAEKLFTATTVDEFIQKLNE